MSYEIELTRRAEKEILKLDAAMFEQIRAVIDSLGDNPRPLGVRKLRGLENEWCLRVGRLRVLYTIEDATQRILIHRVTDRKDVYRGDMQRSRSLIVWAIAEGRSAARGLDRYLMGHSDLPAPPLNTPGGAPRPPQLLPTNSPHQHKSSIANMPFLVPLSPRLQDSWAVKDSKLGPAD